MDADKKALEQDARSSNVFARVQNLVMTEVGDAHIARHRIPILSSVTPRAELSLPVTINDCQCKTRDAIVSHELLNVLDERGCDYLGAVPRRTFRRDRDNALEALIHEEDSSQKNRQRMKRFHDGEEFRNICLVSRPSYIHIVEADEAGYKPVRALLPLLWWLFLRLISQRNARHANWVTEIEPRSWRLKA